MSPHHLPRRRFLLAAGGLGAALVTGCGTVDLSAERDGGNLLDRLRTVGEVRIGFANEAPYGYVDREGRLTGEAPEVAKEVFRRLGVPGFVPALSDFGSLIPGLRAGLFDVIAAGMFITPARCAQIIFSDPDYNAPEAILVRAGDTTRIRSLDDFARDDRLKLGVLLGAVEADVAAGYGVPANRTLTFSTQAGGIDGVLAGRADGLLLTAISLRHALSTRQGAPLELTEPFVPVLDGVEQYGAGGFGFRPDQTRLRDAFNAELAVLKRSGRLLEIVRPFGFTEAEMTDLTAARLCADPAA
ncbi:ectoine/hydroxyectoine ABC transporter substrate-binding protein EhuB [Saccharothrix obliqua]|uniref:ectoine/hydroxyectoine ABC transporter substrate-binding protein EhuB n=1 Tax=Saccharothrix obliqua TaxID=2861747 RepID=UPI001C5E2736|nr:ectoine/hydroxyectoine ABC transporter substrate-binding protein EhuB [Saccharothrix obliqua]MBW4720488.1 ectoine/hydroxyectoine ABC transporter substrate-binding protein EhuB [Saccharothrix obliqua]